MSNQPVMVQIADYQPTLQAFHQACTLARKYDAQVVLLKLQPVQHLSWLGTDFGQQALTEQDAIELSSFQDTAEDYGVPLHLIVFQYAMFPEAISDAADHVDAQIIFARLPTSHIPGWGQYQLRMLHHRLSRHQRQLHLIGAPDHEVQLWFPSARYSILKR